MCLASCLVRRNRVLLRSTRVIHAATSTMWKQQVNKNQSISPLPSMLHVKDSALLRGPVSKKRVAIPDPKQL